MSRIFHPYHRSSFYLFLFLLLIVLFPLIFYGYVGLAFRRLGFSPLQVIMLLSSTLIGSFINIPLFEVKSEEPVIIVREVKWYGIYFKVPSIEVQRTLVAVNLGGAVIPTLAAIYIIAKNIHMLYIMILAIVIVTSIIHLVAKPVKGLGIVTPIFLPPLSAAIIAILLSPMNPAPIAYVSGVLGALIGADLLNLDKISKLGSPMVSIGGAGTFDGIFLTGVLAVLLAW